jgi:acyl-CoA reductase-like NAD-dependent aldehyde dehydrogenase
MYVSEIQYFAGGKWRSAENHKLFDVFRPYDRALYARVSAGGRAEAKQAVEAAAKAYPAWPQTTTSEWASRFFNAVEIVKRHRTEIADILAIETRSTVNVNSPTVNDEIHAPMGGVRDSGWGRTGPDGLK